MNRRNFLRLSAALGTGALLTPELAAQAVPGTPETKPAGIPVRALGRTGIKIPVLSMGVMRADNPNLLRAAYNSGIFHFDTAHGYQNGRNEEMIGNFFQGKPRDTYFISTKIKTDYPPKDDFEKDLDEKLAISLARLKMDYVDIFYLHAPRGTEEVSDKRVMAAMEKIKASGKARFIGFSTHAHRPEQLDAAIEAGIYDVVLLSYNFKLKNLEATNAAIERAANAGIGLIAMKTMAGGTEDAEGKKKINAGACLKWAWENKHITTAIPGFTNYDEFEECTAAAQNTGLTPDEHNYLAALCEEEMLFCQQCNSCTGQCPKHLPIPDIMRAYMYAYGYKYARLSKETLQELNLAQHVCADCDSCLVQCPSGFKVGEKIAAVTPILRIPDEFLS